MARVQRTGFEYTRLDLNFWNDIKVRRAMKYNKLAPTVYIALLSLILKDNYYLVWNEDIPFLLADTIDFAEEEVIECIDILVKVDLIDRDLFMEHGIVTSKGIQKQYNALCESTKRRCIVTKDSQYSLLNGGINSEEIPNNGTKTTENEDKLGENTEKQGILPENSGKSTTKKERKESKENYYSCCFSLSSEATSTEEQQQQAIVFDFMTRNWDKPQHEFFKKFLPWNNSGDRCWKDMDREQRAAAAVQWKQKPTHPPRFPDKFIDMWRDVCALLAEAPSEVMWAALDDGLKWVKSSEGSYVLHCHKCLYEHIERNMDRFKPVICKVFGPIHLQYIIDDDNSQ